MHELTSRRRMAELIERSSLGTPVGRQLRSSVDQAVVEAVLERTRSLQDGAPPPRNDPPLEVPPSRADPAPLAPVTRYTTSFVGRGAEQEDIAARLLPGTVITITGPGGIGKSRLAIEIATRATATDHPHGVRYCDVALATDADTLHERLAASLDLSVGNGGKLRDAIVRALAITPVLLVLDGCEQLRDEVAAVVVDLHASDAVARLLVTSQVRLGVVNEQVVALEPLELPELTDADPDQAPALRLLLDRACAAGVPTVAPDRHLIRLVHRLEGLPLAIELAAPRLASIRPEALIERLDHHLEALSSSQDVPNRHRTLRATFDWSFSLVNPAGQSLLAALSVFRGTWDLEAAAAVAPAVDVDPDRVVVLTTELVEQSIVRVELSAAGTARYRLLDTISTYAAEHLARLGSTREATDLHAGHFLALAERAVPHRRGPHESAWVGELLIEFDNLRAAYRYLVENDEPVEALQLVAALGDELLMRERLEIARWAVDLTAHPGVDDHPLSVVVLGLAANGLMLKGELDAALDLARQALDAQATIPGAPPAWMAHNVLAMAPLAEGCSDGWGEHIRVMEATSEVLGDPFPRALALWNRTVLAAWTKQIDRGAAAAHALLALGDHHDNPSIRSMGLHASGRVALMRHDRERARGYFEDALSAAESALNILMINTTRRELADLIADLGDRDALAALCRIGRSFIESGNLREQVETVMSIVEHLVGLDALEALGPAARALQRLEQSPAAHMPNFSDLNEYVLSRLGPDESAIVLREGAATPLNQVLSDLVRDVSDLIDRAA